MNIISTVLHHVMPPGIQAGIEHMRSYSLGETIESASVEIIYLFVYYLFIYLLIIYLFVIYLFCTRCTPRCVWPEARA
jgi:hypothetical protein